MSRRLTRDETDLWNRLRETVEPLRKRKAAPVKSETAVAAKAAAKKPASARLAPPTAAAKPKASVAPPLAPLEEKTLRRLGRGLIDIDARIDLHGMRQERAFSVLGSFLRHAQARGDKIVLVVTGKGKAEARIGEEGRGVLKQAVPSWLSRDDLRPLVVGFEEANRRHGGSGALYVRIRRRREARPPRA
jgi:DNA-nicking Smr family endonuclease